MLLVLPYPNNGIPIEPKQNSVIRPKAVQLFDLMLATNKSKSGS